MSSAIATTFRALGLTSLLPVLVGQSPGRASVTMTVYGPLLEPVPNAAVTVRRSDWSPIKQGKTDGSGQFFFAGDEGRWFYCCATAPGLDVGCEFTRPLTRESPLHVEVRLFAAATIRGTVRDEKGKPVAGAEVIHAFDNSALMFFKGETEAVTSDEFGAFLLSRVPLGDIAVRASAEGFELGETLVYLREDATVDVVLKRGKGRELVVAVEGVPVERLQDIECRMFVSRPYPQPQMRVPPRLERGRFDQKGQCVISGLPREPELSMIRLEAGGMRFHPQWQKVEPGKDGRVTFRLDAITGPRPGPAPAVAEPAAPAAAEPEPEPGPLVPSRVENPTLRGVLRDESGKPRGLTRVRLYADRTGWREAVTAEDGTFAVDAKYEPGDQIAFELRNPDWVLVDKAPQDWMGMGSIWRQYERGRVEDLVVSAAAKVRGIVEAPRGESVAGLSVWLEVGGPNQSSWRYFAGSGATDAKGAFVIDGFRQPEGDVWLAIRGLCGTAEAGPFKFGGQRTLEGIVLKLQAPHVVTGTIVDRAGKPIPGARLKLLAQPGKVEGSTLGATNTLSDAKGRFAFRGMKAGEYLIEARVRGAEVAAKTKPFEVSAKKRAIDQQIKVPGN